MREPVGLDTQGKRSTSFLESIGTCPDRSFRCKQDSRDFHSLNTVTVTVSADAKILRKMSTILLCGAATR